MKKHLVLLFVLLSYSTYAQCENLTSNSTLTEENKCDGLDNDCDGRVDELSTCCNPLINPRRDCMVKCLDGSETIGYNSCVNYQYNEECIAACPHPVGEITITYPKNEETYEICKGAEIGSLNIFHTGIGQCTYKINQNSYIGINKDTRFKPKLGENRLIVKCDSTAQSVFYLKEITCTQLPSQDGIDILISEGIDEEIVDQVKNDTVDQELIYIKNGNEATNPIVTNDLDNSIKQEEKKKISFWNRMHNWFLGLFR